MPTKTEKLKKLEKLNEAAEGLGIAYGSIYFIFISNLNNALKDAFSTLGNYFQTAGFVLNGALFLLNLIRFGLDPNKNAGKVGDLFLGAVQLTLLGLATFGVLAFGAIAVGVLFAASTALDMAISLVKSVYYGIRSGIEANPGQKRLYRDEASDASLKLIFTGIAAIIFILAIMSAPYIGLSVVAILSILIGVFLASVGIAAIVKAVYKTFFENENEVLEKSENAEDMLPSPSTELDSSLDEKNALTLDPKENLKEEKDHSSYSEPSKPSFLSFFWNYYDHSMVKASYSPDEIISSIGMQKTKLVSEMLQDAPVAEGGTVHLEHEKRSNKHQALSILEEFVKKIENKEIFSNGGTISFNSSGRSTDEPDENDIILDEGDIEFIYDTPLDLKKQFNDYIVKEFPGVFQSFFYDVGKTEQLFAKAYQLLKDSRYVKPTPHVAVEGDEKPASGFDLK